MKPEKYQPSPEEINKAEEMMSGEQKKLSEARENESSRGLPANETLQDLKEQKEKERPINAVELLNSVEKFAVENGFILRKRGENEENSRSVEWRSEIKKSPYPEDDDMTGLQMRLYFSEQLPDGGYGWVELSLLYIHAEPETRKWITEKGLPEGKSWDDYVARDPYRGNQDGGDWNARVDFYRNRGTKNYMNRDEADASELFEGYIRSDKSDDRTHLTMEAVEQEMNRIIEVWNSL